MGNKSSQNVNTSRGPSWKCYPENHNNPFQTRYCGQCGKSKDDSDRLRQEQERQVQRQRQMVSTRSQQPSNERELRAFLTALILKVGAYEFADVTTKKKVIRKLRNITPNNQTAFYDATMTGIVRMLELFRVLCQVGETEYKYVQIILTDGADTQSNSSFDDVHSIMGLIKPLGAECRTIFIGVEIEQRVRRELRSLSIAGGDNCEFYEVGAVDLESLFERIELSLGITHRLLALGNEEAMIVMGQREHHVVISVNHYCIFFNLDISGSMSGGKWKKVCNSVESFLSHLSSDDLIGCAVFNHQVKIISGNND